MWCSNPTRIACDGRDYRNSGSGSSSKLPGPSSVNDRLSKRIAGQYIIRLVKCGHRRWLSGRVLQIRRNLRLNLLVLGRIRLLELLEGAQNLGERKVGSCCVCGVSQDWLTLLLFVVLVLFCSARNRVADELLDVPVGDKLERGFTFKPVSSAFCDLP
jgi:hypothetical protein